MNAEAKADPKSDGFANNRMEKRLRNPRPGSRILRRLMSAVLWDWRGVPLSLAQILLLDWIILEAPPPFIGALRSLQDPAQWQQTREQLFSKWLQGPNIPALIDYVREDMGSYPFEMWARAGREFSAAYGRAGSPLQALANLEPPVQVLHLYAQPDDPGYLAAQRSFSAAHPWFQASKLEARSQFPMYEVPDQMARAIERFAA